MGPHEMPHPYSLRRRLLLWLLLPLSLLAAIALLDARLSASATATEIFDRVLAGSALAISERVFVNTEGRLDVDIPYVALDMLTSAAQDRVFYRLEAGDGGFVNGYDVLTLPEATGDGIAGLERFTFADGSFRGAPIRLAVLDGVATDGTRSIPYRIAVAETTNARKRLTNTLSVRAAARLALLILAAAALVWLAVTRALRPLNRVEKAIGRRNPTDLRPIEHEIPTEVTGLVNGINGFMLRLGGALGALRNFASNASHQLRTPLTIVHTQTEIARRAGSAEEQHQALATIDAAAREMEATLAQLMLIARIEEEASKPLQNAQTDIAATAQTVVADMVQDAAARGFDLGYQGADTLVARGDQLLLREALRNLITNALIHASTAGTITVSTQPAPDGVSLNVEDDGVGIPPDQIAAALARFGKLPGRPSPGSGLGLAIVADIVSLFGGVIRLGVGQAGKGLRVSLTLPAI